LVLVLSWSYNFGLDLGLDLILLVFVLLKQFSFLRSRSSVNDVHQIDRKSHRTKDILSALNEVLLRLKPSTFKDNYLASFKV